MLFGESSHVPSIATRMVEVAVRYRHKALLTFARRWGCKSLQVGCPSRQFPSGGNIACIAGLITDTFC
jgi:uncharacterized HAD superfamily protein